MSGIVETPEEFDVLTICGVLFYIDRTTRREIEAFLEGNPKPYDAITIDDLNGHEVLVIASCVASIFSSSTDVRASERAFVKKLEAEEAGI
jgi:hypothetical protein